MGVMLFWEWGRKNSTFIRLREEGRVRYRRPYLTRIAEFTDILFNRRLTSLRVLTHTVK